MIPELKRSGILASLGQGNLTYILIALVFTTLYVIIKFGHKKLHLRNFRRLINANGKQFRLKLFLKGLLYWGLILFTAQLILDYAKFETFLQNFEPDTFLITFALSGIALLFRPIGKN